MQQRSPIKSLLASDQPTRTHCEKHGEPLVPAKVPSWMEERSLWDQHDYSARHAYCLTCADETAAREEAKQRQVDEEVFRYRQAGAGIPPRFLNASLQDFAAGTAEQQTAMAVLRQFQETYGQAPSSLIFSGNLGVGKTHAAAALVTAWLRSGRTAHFCSAMDLVRTIRDTWGTHTSERSVLKKYTEVGLLAIDEVGQQSGTPTERAILGDAINARYEHLRPTIVVGNLTIEEFNAFLGERAMDRFREGGRMLVFPWASRRGQK